MRRSAGLWLAAVVAGTALFMAGCEGDSGGDEVSVSGDSSLRVHNESDSEWNVYFDDDFIGSVDKDVIREWSVPSGSHEVTLKNADIAVNDISEDYTFSDGGGISVTVN